MKKFSALIFTLFSININIANANDFDPLNSTSNLQNINSNLISNSNLTSNSTCENLKNFNLQNLNEFNVIDLTLCNNPRTREVWANTLYQAANLGAAKSAYFPTISATLDATNNYSKQRQTNSKNQNRAGRLNFSWLLYDFGGRTAKVNQANFLLQAAIFSQNSTIQTLILNSLTAFYDAKAKQALVISTKESELTAAESFNAAKTKYEVGITTPADVLQAQTAHSQSVLNHIKAVGDFKIALSNLLNSMGIALPANATTLNNLISPFDINAVNIKTFTPKQLQTIKQEISTALQNRPDLLALKQQIEASKENLKIIKTQFLPSVNLSASYNKQYNKSNSSNSNSSNNISSNSVYFDSSSNYWSNSNSLTLSVNIPIFSGFSTYYQQKAAEQQIQQNIAKYQNLENSIGTEIWSAYENLQTAFQSIRTTNDLLKSATRSQEMALGRYKSGVGNLIDVLNAQSALASAKQQKIQAILDWQKNKIQLAYALGNLNHTALEK